MSSSRVQDTSPRSKKSRGYSGVVIMLVHSDRTLVCEWHRENGRKTCQGGNEPILRVCNHFQNAVYFINSLHVKCIRTFFPFWKDSWSWLGIKKIHEQRLRRLVKENSFCLNYTPGLVLFSYRSLSNSDGLTVPAISQWNGAGIWNKYIICSIRHISRKCFF